MPLRYAEIRAERHYATLRTAQHSAPLCAYERDGVAARDIASAMLRDKTVTRVIRLRVCRVWRMLLFYAAEASRQDREDGARQAMLSTVTAICQA